MYSWQSVVHIIYKQNKTIVQQFHSMSFGYILWLPNEKYAWSEEEVEI